MSPAAEGPPAPAALVLDVRAVAPKDRLDTLRAEREPGFGFEYVERGSARWRVLVTKPAAAR